MARKKRTWETCIIPKTYRAPQKAHSIASIERISQHIKLLQGFEGHEDFWKEAAILEATCHRSWNQYRGTEYFERIKEVWRVIRQIDSLQLRNMIGLLGEELKGHCVGTCMVVPSQECLAICMSRLLAGCKLILVLIDAIERAACPLIGTIARGYNAPHGLFWLATISRLRVLAASMFDDLIQIYNALSTAVVFCPNHSSYPKPSMLLSLPTGVCKNVDGVVTYLQALHSPNWKDKMQEAEESLQLGGDLQQDQSNVMSTMAGMTTNNQDNALEHNTAHQSCFQGAPVVRYSEHGQNMNHMHPLAQARTLGHAKVTPSTRKPGGASLDSMMRMRTQGLHSRLSTDYESRNSKAVRRTGADWKEKQRIGSTKNTMQQKCGDERLKTGRFLSEAGSHPFSLEISSNPAAPSATVVSRPGSGAEAHRRTTNIRDMETVDEGDAPEPQQLRTLQSKKRKQRRKKSRASTEESRKALKWDEWFEAKPS